MIYDCFSFFNELDLLEIRLNTLDKVVDKFILAESTLTFTGKPKPLYYLENKDMFAKFKDRIIHIVVDDFPPLSGMQPREMAWIRETWQRNAVMRGIPNNASDDDYVIIADLDEIPRPSAVTKAISYPGVSHLQLKMFYYFVNYKNYSNPNWLGGPQIVPLYVFKSQRKPTDNELIYPVDWRINNGITPSIVRFLKPQHVIKNAGWHFSFCGGIRTIQKKIESFSHTEYDSDKFKNEAHIRECLLDGRDVFGRGDRFFALPFSSLPKCIAENRERYDHLIYQFTVRYWMRTLIPRLSTFAIRFLRKVLRPLLPRGMKDWLYSRVIATSHHSHT